MLSRDLADNAILCICLCWNGLPAYIQASKQTIKTCIYATKSEQKTCFAILWVMEGAMFAWIQTIIYKLTDILSHATIYYRYVLFYQRISRSKCGCVSSLFILLPRFIEQSTILILIRWHSFFILSFVCVCVCSFWAINLVIVSLTLTHTHPSTNAWLHNDKCDLDTSLYCLIDATSCYIQLWYGLMWCVFGMMCRF